MKRQKLTEEELLKRLNEELSKHAECVDCTFDTIWYQDPGPRGCNWHVPSLECRGSDTKLCKPIADEIVHKMKREYNLF